MRKSLLSLAAMAIVCASQAQSVATFEDLALPAESYWDGSDLSGCFTSGGYLFVNNFTDWGGYTSWDGFAYSNTTSTQYLSLDDQYNSCVGQGAGGSATYGVVYYSSYMGTEPTVIAADAAPFDAKGCYVTNAAYAYTSMLNGDAYAKQFDASDWFLITATGYLDKAVTGTAEFYLAQGGLIVNDWLYFDLHALGQVDEIHFTLSSSDTGVWGMNTPAYFCLDNFGVEDAVSLNRIERNAAARQRFDLMGRRVEAGKTQPCFITNVK